MNEALAPDQADRIDELWPNHRTNIAIDELIGSDQRDHALARPWVVMVMVSALDGAISVDGVSGGLGGPADHQRFVAVRHQMDAIIVGAVTATVENYRPTKVPIAVVSGSLSLDPSARLFSDPQRQPLLYTTSGAAEDRGHRFDGIAQVVDLGDSIKPDLILGDLFSRGVSTVALEGGPTLNGSFLGADVVDEMLLSFSPHVVGGGGPSIAEAEPFGLDRRFGLRRVLRSGDFLFARYLRQRTRG